MTDSIALYSPFPIGRKLGNLLPSLERLSGVVFRDYSSPLEVLFGCTNIGLGTQEGDEVRITQVFNRLLIAPVNESVGVAKYADAVRSALQSEGMSPVQYYYG
ncbi:hypothetical protein JXC34_06820 [Candidatus Woesearchaeota archaeon]|nr:hypothetical protein [Candidatus Woesearchaeota archaeon]